MITVLLILLSCTVNKASKSANQSNNKVGDTGNSNKSTDSTNNNTLPGPSKSANQSNNNVDDTGNSNKSTNGQDNNNNSLNQNAKAEDNNGQENTIDIKSKKDKTDITYTLDDIFKNYDEMSKYSAEELIKYFDLIISKLELNDFEEKYGNNLHTFLGVISNQIDKISNEQVSEFFQKLSAIELKMDHVSLRYSIALISSRLNQIKEIESRNNLIDMNIVHLAELYNNLILSNKYATASNLTPFLDIIDNYTNKSKLIYELIKIDAAATKSIQHYFSTLDPAKKIEHLKPLFLRIWQEKNLEMYEKFKNHQKNIMINNLDSIAISFVYLYLENNKQDNQKNANIDEKYAEILLALSTAKNINKEFKYGNLNFENIFELASILEISEDNKFIFDIIIFEIKLITNFDFKKTEEKIETNLKSFKRGQKASINIGRAKGKNVFKNRDVFEYFRSKLFP